MDDAASLESFWGGAAGEPVPKVDPSDIQVVWEMGQDLKRRHPEGRVSIGVNLYKARCKPGADISATTYRASMVALLQLIMPMMLDPLIQDKQDAVLVTAAEVPMEWLGREERKGLPFDADDFIRRVRAAV
jgi:hypothetical protein